MKRHTGRISTGWAAGVGVVALLVAGFAACEVAGWPFLASPVQRALSKTLQREVLFNEGQASGATVRFLGGLKVKLPQLQIAAPSWSERPYFLRATHAEMHLS